MITITFDGQADARVCGIIEDANMYERWKCDEIDFKDHIKPYITHIKMPYDVAVRLMKIDRVLDEWSKVPDLAHIIEQNVKEKNNA